MKTISRCISLILALMMIVPMGLIFSDNASAIVSNTFSSQNSRTGFIDRTGAVYTWVPESTFSYVKAGTNYPAGDQHRALISFNTSTLPDTAVIQSAIFTIRCLGHWYQYSYEWGINIDVYINDYVDTSTPVTSWSPIALIGSFTPSQTTYGAILSLTIPGDYVSLTNYTVIELVSSNEAYYSGRYFEDDSSLSVQYGTPSSPTRIDMRMSDGITWANGTAYPDIQSYNSTHDLWKFQFDVLPLVNFISISKEVDNSTVFALSPACTYSDNTYNVTLTNIYTNITYRLWLAVPKTGGYNTAILNLYDSNTGRGIPWGQYNIRMSEGDVYDEATSYAVYSQSQTVIGGYTYSINVSDYFGRNVLLTNFTSNTNNQGVNIPITVFNWKFTNQRDHFCLMTIYYNGYPSAYNYSLYVAPKSTESLDLQNGNYSFSAQTYYNNGTAGSIEWFNRTVNGTAGFVILEGTTWIKANLYNGFTGLGLPWYQFNVTYQIEDDLQNESATDSMIPAKFDHNLTIVVRDFFNRELYNATRMITGNSTSWNIPIYIYSTKYYNERDNFTLLRVWYDGYAAGHLPYSEFLMPRFGTELYLIGGPYTFAFSVYPSNGTYWNIHSYWWNQTVSNALFTYLTGNNITQISGGILSLQTSTAQGVLDILTSNTGLGLILNDTQTSILWSLVNNSNWSNMTGLQVINELNLTEAQLAGLILNGTSNTTANITILLSYVTPRIHLSYYNAFTGIGIAPYSFNVSAKVDGLTSLSRIQTDLAAGVLNRNLTVIVKDFFGRELYNESKNITSVDYYWDVPLYVYSYKVVNQADQFTRWWIYYNMSAPPYREFIPPREYSEYFLLAGTYRFATTVYDSGGVTGTTYTYIRTISDAGYVMLNGATITEVLNVAKGVKATQKVITDILNPDIVFIGWNMPTAPAHISGTSNQSSIYTRYVVEASSYQIDSGTYLYFNRTTPNPTDVTTLDIISDTMYFVGDPYTTILVNETNASTVYSASTLPSSVGPGILTGTNYTIWTNSSISATRICTFRYSDAFSYGFYPNATYRVDITIENPSNFTWSNVYLFVPFQNKSYVDNETVTVFDINNTVLLIEGSNYILSKDGIHLSFNSVSNNTFRGFRVEYKATNWSLDDVPIITVTRVGDDSGLQTTWGSTTWYFCDASWTNVYRKTYHGAIYINLQISMGIEASSIKVLDASGNVIIQASVTGTSIYIPTITVNAGASISFKVIFQSTGGIDEGTKDTVSTMAYAMMALCLIIGTMFTRFNKKFSEAQKKRYEQIGTLILMIGMLNAIVMLFATLLSATG